MATNANKVRTKSSGPKQPLIKAGGYPGRVVQVIDYGLQPQSYNGEVKDPANEIGLTYELVDEFCVAEDGTVQEDKPRWISESFPLHSLKAEKAKSTQRYKILDPSGKFGGEFLDLINAPCLVNIIENPGKGKNVGKVYNNVATLSLLREKELSKLPELKGTPIAFSLDNPDLEVFNSFPDFIQDKIKSNLEFNGSKLQKLLGGVQKDEHGVAQDDNSQEDTSDKTKW